MDLIYTSDDDDTCIDLFCNNKKFFILNVIHVNGVADLCSTLGENSTFLYEKKTIFYKKYIGSVQAKES